MKRPAIRTNPKTTITILSVSPYIEDDGALQDIGREHPPTTSHPTCRFELIPARKLQNAIHLLRTRRIPIAVCEGDCGWRELLEQTAAIPEPPLVIVTSRLADERMWAEVLNLGGWDVLAKPFNPTEVMRAVESAWLHWTAVHGTPANAQKLHAASFVA